MEGWHFGINCRHYIPRFGNPKSPDDDDQKYLLEKCRVKIDKYMEREDLLEEKWVVVEKAIIFLGIPGHELIEKIESRKFKVKIPKAGKPTVRIRAAWQWDDCPLADAGGQCLYFEPHGGQKITCLMDRFSIKEPHPSAENLPSQSEIERVENDIRAIPDVLKKG